MPEPIASYGLLGDTRTAALVSARGSIDWLCIPRFDGPPVFGTLVDPVCGGRWRIAVAGGRIADRSYVPHAASIRTEWEGPQGRATVRDGMVADASSRLVPRSMLVRRIACTAGVVRIEVLYDPRLGLPGRPPQRIRSASSSVICSWGATAVSLSWNRALEIVPGATCGFELRAGESVCFVAGVAVREPLVFVAPEVASGYLDQDDHWWQRWTRRFSYEGPSREHVLRSLITLRLLTYAPSGAPVAAPTTSLPAPIGGDGNWDYRFSWPRDASIGAGAFLAFGSDEEPRAFLEWFVNASHVTRPRLDVLYDLDGRAVRYEREVAGVAGFDGSAPVRLGNAAARQHQLDAYGWVIDAAWLMHARGIRLTGPQWGAVRRFADFLASDWRRPDNGIWEERGPRRQYVHSKLMAWTGLDRACRLAEHYPAKRAHVWRAHRDAVAAEIRAHGFDRARNTYRRVFDDDEVDASLLILPLTGFEEDQSRIHGTIDAIRERLGAGGALLYRYRGPEREGAFLPCSFWLVQALVHARRFAEAEVAFDELCALATPLGLYAEQVDPVSRAPLGNFPQAFTHATFLCAAAALNEARETTRG